MNVINIHPIYLFKSLNFIKQSGINVNVLNSHPIYLFKSLNFIKNQA